MSSNRATARADQNAAVHWITLERSKSVSAVLLDPDGWILRCNDLFRKTVGPDALAKQANLSQWLEGAESWQSVMSRAGKPDAPPVKLAVDRPDGRPLTLRGELIGMSSDAGNPCVVGLFTSCAEIDSAQAILARNARLEALVCLTSGVAHDFNNLLTVLSGNLALAAEDVREFPKTFSKLKSARDAANRGGELIRQLLAFAKQKEIGSELIDPVRIVRAVAPLVERALGGNIELSLDLDESAGQFHASAVQYESAIVNLAVNARDALTDGGHVRISVRSAGADGKPGTAPSVVTVVADDGPGIPASLIAKVREPFFTTKSGRGGTGLGLSMVDAFARQHGGELDIRSEAGRGTQISLSFPRAGDRLDESIAATMPLLALPSGNETIVAVARDTSLLSTVEQILTVLGYSVHCATGLQDASESIRTRRPQLVVADGFDVRALLNACSALGDGQSCRGLQLVAQSERNCEAETNADESAVLRLAKPFSLPDFAKYVRKVLDREI